jgi:hypothetical protein
LDGSAFRALAIEDLLTRPQFAEIHDDAFGPDVALASGIEEIRSWRWTVVVADVVQFDLQRAGRADSDEHHGVRRLHTIAEQCGAVKMAIRVNAPSARERATAIGATLARGTEIGLPGELPET